MHENLDYSKIPAFLAAAECLNFTVAANKLYITQSALSKSVAALESALGFPLFIRGNRKVSLTAEGAYLYNEFSRIMKDAGSAIETAKFMSKGYMGSFTIGTSGYMAKNPIFERICSQFSLEHPSFDIELHLIPYSEVRQHLIDGKLDIVLTNHLNTSSFHGYRMLRLSHGKAILLCNPIIYDSYPSGHLTIRDFKNHNFVCINQSSEHLNYINSACEAYGFRPNITRFTDSIMEAVHYIGNTGCITIFDRTMFPMLDSDLKVIDIPPQEGMMRMDTVLLWKKDSQNQPLLSYVEFASNLLGTEIIDI